MPEVRIGISGWRYPPWRTVFYPVGLAQRLELEYASRQVSSIEINGSFYSLQRPEAAGQLLRLRGAGSGRQARPGAVAAPPNLGFDAGRIAEFLDQLPRTTTQAASLAASHDERLEGRSWLTTDADRPLRHAMEVRHPSYETSEFSDLLRAHEVAIVTADTAGKWPMLLEPTTDLAYVRLHGDSELYVSEYTDEALDLWARRIADWREGGADVVAYFDNDAKVAAPFDARRLMARLGLTPAAAGG